jgi:hypothetical protein
LLLFQVSIVEIWLDGVFILFQKLFLESGVWQFFGRFLQLFEGKKLRDPRKVEAFAWLLVFSRQDFSEL